MKNIRKMPEFVSADKHLEREKRVKFNRSVYQSLVMIGQFGINMLVPVFACSFLGIFLDKKLGTSYLVIILFFAGALAGGRNVYRFAQKIYEKDSSASAYLHEGAGNRHKAVSETREKREADIPESGKQRTGAVHEGTNHQN